jgi:hypothetical protein
MLGMCIGTLIVGVYSPFYSNGGIFMFFIALFNIYIYSLIYLNWPSDTMTPVTLHEQIELQDYKKSAPSRNSGGNAGYKGKRP